LLIVRNLSERGSLAKGERRGQLENYHARNGLLSEESWRRVTSFYDSPKGV